MALTLSSSVGAGGANQKADVTALQKALQRASDLTLDPRVHPGPADGASGDGTEGAIARFQSRLGYARPDARIDPGGNTLRRLNALLAIGETDLGFPFRKSPTKPYVGPGAGMRSFGWRRSGGARAHAGVDLYFPDFTDVYAVADGTVTRGPYPFYLRTFALEVDHGTFVARYGELAPDATPPVKAGDSVTKGQKVGRVGILTHRNGKRLGVSSMMLHFEMYDKTQTGALTRALGTSARHTNRKPFFRRRDLIDPTGFLRRAPLRP
ncbi:M23 family metallopeptidase [Rubrivirga sp. IMCC45206]|uniref:M23 family metallopeptidase n=1 Tax=Rubrivirga sp. IMCC45206 TaxID=3391614 RepID=UPI003990137B